MKIKKIFATVPALFIAAYGAAQTQVDRITTVTETTTTVAETTTTVTETTVAVADSVPEASVPAIDAFARYGKEGEPVTFVSSTTVAIIMQQMFGEDPKAEKSKATKEVKDKRIRDYGKMKFAFGADLGSSIDLTGQDMTSAELNGYVGMRNNYFRFIGIGGSIRMMTSNSSRAYPVYAMLRTGFSERPTLCFMQFKAGMSFNNYYTNIYQRRFFGGIGVGITLAHSPKFSSHIILSYEYMNASRRMIDPMLQPLSDIHYASIRIGISF